MSDKKIRDVIIIGGGPAGYTAALYAARAGLDALVIEKFSAGGQMTETMQIDNYPGFDEGVDGFTLGAKMQAGAERFGAETLHSEVLSVELAALPKKVTLDTGEELLARSVMIATGAVHKHLGVADEEKLIGRGVGYCAACDGMLYRGKTVAVVGGGNSAAADALLLSKICEKVYLIHRRDSLRAERIYHEPLMNAQNVEFVWDSEVESLSYEMRLDGVRVRNKKSGESRDIKLDGLFISIGRVPATELFATQIELDGAGYIIADETTQTSVDGVYAIGDVRTKPFRQIATAVADGAVAAHLAESYISNL